MSISPQMRAPVSSGIRAHRRSEAGQYKKEGDPKSPSNFVEIEGL